MVHVFLRIAVWVLVIGMGYLMFGPELFDSSRTDNPFASHANLFLPPAKLQREVAYENILMERELRPEELAEYQQLVQKRQSDFWKGDGVAVEDALAGIQHQRKAYLATLLKQRGLSSEEAAIFLMVVERDHPAILTDQTQ